LATTLEPPIQTPILNRLGDVGGLDFFGAGEIGDGAADFEDPAVGAGAQAQFVLAPALRISDWVVAAHDTINRATIACLG
jgi:hypothetical protein